MSEQIAPPGRPYLGFGLGLRPDHYEVLLEGEPRIDWLEIISENYMVPGGKPLYYLDRIRERYPVVMHGVSMSLGSTDPLNWDYLRDLKSLAERARAVWMSDHLCWTGVHRANMHDLLPLPYTDESLAHVVKRIQAVQDFLGQRLVVENPSTYVTFRGSTISEAEFLAELAKAADCEILLDVNNVYVSAFNHGFDPLGYLDELPRERVVQIHLAGHKSQGNYIVDTHDEAVIDPVWSLYAEAARRFPRVSTMIERDDNIPPLEALISELQTARRLAGSVPVSDAA